jgi:hypothetical protein
VQVAIHPQGDYPQASTELSKTMDYLERFTATRLKRIREKTRRLQAQLKRSQGSRAMLAPEFESSRMVDKTWFLASQKGEDQPVKIPEYDFPSDNNFDEDLIVFERKRSRELDESYQQLGPQLAVANVTFPLDVVMPGSYMNDEDEFDFRYRVFSAMTSGWYESPPTRAILDWTPPHGRLIPDAAIFPFPSTHRIDSAYLAGLANGELIVTIPPYDFRQPTDRVVWGWFTEVPELPLPPTKVFDVALNDDHKVSVPVSVIDAEGEGSGVCYFFYLLYDKALNQSRLSQYIPVSIALGDLPSGVGAPTVPLAQDPDGLTYGDLDIGVEVEISSLQGVRFSDEVIVKWGDTELPARRLEDAGFPFRVSIPHGVIKQEYDAAGGGQVTTSVSYKVRRGQNDWPSPTTQIDTDFTLIGPPNPNWPEPVNPNLPTIKVKSASGDFDIIEGDENIGEPATAQFLLYAPVSEAALIQLYWGARPVGAVYPVDASATPGTPIEIEVTWEDIKAGGDNLALPVSYGIRAANGLNELRCTPQPVKVSVIPVDLPAPTFPQTQNDPGNPLEYINCNVALQDRGRIWLRIPYVKDYIYSGVEVHVWWKGFERHNDPTLPPGPGAPVPASDYDEVIIWEPADQPEDASYDICIIEPASDRLFTLHPADSGYGFCQCYYTIEANGRTLTSDVITKRVSMGTANGLCQIP